MRRKRWLLLAIQNERWRLMVTILFSLLTAGCSCALIFTSGYLISKSALHPENILLVYIPIVMVRAFGIGKAVSRYVERLVGHDMVLRMLSNMRVLLYRILEPQALFVRSRYRTGDLLSTLADDIEHLQNFYIRTVFPILVALVVFALWLIVFGIMDFAFALMMGLVVGLLVYVLPMVSLWVTYRKLRKIKQWKNGLYQQLTDMVLGLPDWIIRGQQTAFLQDYSKEEAKVASIQRSLHRFRHWRMFFSQSLVGIAILLMAYWTGQSFADGELSSPMIAAAVLSIFPLMDLFVPVSDAMEQLPQYRDSIRRIEQLDRERISISGQESVVSKKELGSVERHADLRVENLTFYYDPSSKEGIQDLSIDIPAGKKVAILGPSGAGKSTLIKLLRGDLVPQRGRAMIHGIDVHRFGNTISQVISVCDQRPHLFDTTVVNNIRLGKPDASDEEIREVAKQVKLDRLIQSLPRGYQTPMLEMGSRFSGGERQRIALARVLLQDAPIVILDEPTVGLDPRTEHDLLQTIFQVFKEKTIIWITHHLMGVRQVDEVLFLEDGRVAMRGSHEVLYQQEVRYRRLYQLDQPFELGKAKEGSNETGCPA